MNDFDKWSEGWNDGMLNGWLHAINTTTTSSDVSTAGLKSVFTAPLASKRAKSTTK